MLNQDIKKLTFLCEMGILEGLAMEGGAVLSILYKLDRPFSGDFDFTIDSSKELYIWESKVRKLSDDNGYSFNKNTLDYVNSYDINFRDISIKIDIVIVPNKYIDTEVVNVTLINKDFTIKIHSLEDIYAEKMCGIEIKERQKKDQRDVNLIKPILNDPTKAEQLYLTKRRIKNL